MTNLKNSSRNHNNVDAGFLGSGWSLSALMQHENLAISSGEENIRESIWIILSTSPGERLMRPAFGCKIHDLVFSIVDAAALGRMRAAVWDALVFWEPRIDVLDVGVETKGRGEVLLINVHYQVRATNNFFNLVYPFYLIVGSGE